MRLVMMASSPGGAAAPGERKALLEMTAEGVIQVPGNQQHRGPPIQVREPGCLHMGPVLWEELLPDGRFWVKAGQDDLRLVNGRLSSAGGVATFEPDGTVRNEPKPAMPLQFQLEGFQPGHECAAAMLYMFWFSTMPNGSEVEPREPDTKSRCQR